MYVFDFYFLLLDNSAANNYGFKESLLKSISKNYLNSGISGYFISFEHYLKRM